MGRDRVALQFACFAVCVSSVVANMRLTQKDPVL